MTNRKLQAGDATKPYRAQLEAAYVLLSEDATTSEKIEKLKILLSGINLTLDKKLEQLMGAYNHLKAALNSDVIHLSAHSIPEPTPQTKKHKKLLLVFLTSWKSLKSEVKRVQDYHDQSNGNVSSSTLAGSAAKTALFAKGPFGLVTLVAIIAVGASIFLKQATTTITIENHGCPPLMPVAKLPVNVPGLRLPEEAITPSTPGTAKLPAIPITVQVSGKTVTATAFNQSGSYVLSPSTTDVRFDGKSLLNTTTQLHLNTARSHTLVIECQK